MILLKDEKFLNCFTHFNLFQPAPEGLLRVTQAMTITNVPVDKLDKFLTKRDWVVRLVDCLVDIGYCNMKFGLALHGQ